MADYEGYLLLHDMGKYADPLYFELGNGMLQYFTRRNGELVGQFKLTRHRVVAKTLAGSHSPFRFTVDLWPVRSVYDTERPMKGCQRTTVVLSAPGEVSEKQWIHAFQTWRRRNWKESMLISAEEEDLRFLQLMMQKYRMQYKVLTGALAPPAPVQKPMPVAVSVKTMENKDAYGPTASSASNVGPGNGIPIPFPIDLSLRKVGLLKCLTQDDQLRDSLTSLPEPTRQQQPTQNPSVSLTSFTISKQQQQRPCLAA